MKSHLAKVSLALLSTAFLLGCQEQGSELVGPDTEIGGANFLHQKKNPKPHGGGGPGAFEATFSGDVISPAPIRLNANLSTLAATLDLSFFDGKDVITDGSVCFSTGPFTGGFSIGVGKKNDPGNAVMLISFDALGTNGTVVNYGLFLFGDTEGKLPPDVGQSTTIAWTTFDMHHSNGPGNKVACSGTGSLNSSTVVTNTTTPTT